MKIHLSLIVVVLLLGCQTKKKEDGYNSQNVLSQIPSKRYVASNVLVSHELPEVEIAVNEEFRFVGNFDFEIIAASDEYPEEIQGKPVANGERFVFVSTDENRAVLKMFIVQFEGWLPEVDFTYNYDFSNAEPLGENKYRHNSWFYDSKKLAQENPNGEGAKTRAFLEKNGYSLEDQFMMSRFVGLASEDRKHEIIIFYLEMLNRTTGYSLDEYENSIEGEEAKSIRKAFVQRSRNSFNITKG